ERKHHFSIDTHVLHLSHNGKHLNLLDAPGYPDFIGAALESLAAVETAVIVVSAINGVEMNTRRMFQEASKRGLARMMIINKLDADKIDFAGVVKSLQTAFGKNCVLFNVPNAVGPELREVISLLRPPGQLPSTLPIDVASARTQLIDAVVECDEALMEKYLSEGTISDAELEAAVPHAIEAGTLIPILCTSAKKGVGIRELLDALCQYAPSPQFAGKRLADYVITTNGQQHPLQPSETEEFIGQVFKVVNDKFVGNLSYIRVLCGKLEPNHPVINLRSGQSLRIAHIYEVQGTKTSPIGEAVPGDIVAVAKVDGLEIGDTLSYSPQAPKLPVPIFPTPMFGVAVEPKNRGDEQKISQSLQKVAAEDPTLKVAHDPQTNELVVSGISQLHLDVIRERLKARFGLEINTKEPKIPYRETVTAEGQGDYRHKKQTGGRGQFAEVHLRIYPLPRDIKDQAQCEAVFANKSRFEKMRACHYDPNFNFAFIDHIVGGVIPNNFIPAVEKGCKEMLERGVLAGYRIQDVAVEVYFGKHHEVDSSEAAFKIATRQAFKKAFLSARPVLLEPIVRVEITVPSKYTGAVLSDLPTKRAQVENQESLPGDLTVIYARAPLAEMSRYAAQLGGLTQGSGSYSMEFSHYEIVPPNIQQQIVSKAQLKEEEEE
ncbi:MAG: elongation factor G, partial [Gemmataceae bacterium]|nr:elongation factor G [Gemmataceae bacterium]